MTAMTPIVVYAIRQKSTGYFMPQPVARRSFSNSKPIPDCVPRCFRKRSLALTALAIWLSGDHATEWVRRPDAADMEVVELVIAEPAPTTEKSL